MPEPTIVSLPVLGWREWATLPTLGIDRIKAKVDTGARTSALHTCGLEVYQASSGEERVRFAVHPLQRTSFPEIECDCPVYQQKVVKDSGGHEEMRPFIRIPIRLGDQEWDISFSLTSRENMKFRMLLGRTAMAGRFLVNPAKSYQYGRKPA